MLGKVNRAALAASHDDVLAVGSIVEEEDKADNSAMVPK